MSKYFHFLFEKYNFVFFLLLAAKWFNSSDTNSINKRSAMKKTYLPYVSARQKSWNNLILNWNREKSVVVRYSSCGFRCFSLRWWFRNWVWSPSTVHFNFQKFVPCTSKFGKYLKSIFSIENSFNIFGCLQNTNYFSPC